jgi:hypothetical protein
MADSLIRWKRGDYVRLSKAVASFNRKINELDVDEAKYLPDLKNYKEIKESIMSRKELNRIVKSLRKFNIEGMELKVELPSGQELTKWEYNQLKLGRNRALRLLESKLEMQERDNPYAKFGIDTKEIETTKQTIKSLGRLETERGLGFTRITGRIGSLGSYDYDLRKAETFRNNYMKVFENMSSYDNYEILKSKLESIKNPEEFYEFVKSSPILMDLFEIGDSLDFPTPDSQTYGGFTTNQEAFNTGLEQAGLM